MINYIIQWDYYDLEDLDVVVDNDGVINPDDDDKAIGGKNRKTDIFAGLQASDLTFTQCFSLNIVMCFQIRFFSRMYISPLQVSCLFNTSSVKI